MKTDYRKQFWYTLALVAALGAAWFLREPLENIFVRKMAPPPRVSVKGEPEKKDRKIKYWTDTMIPGYRAEGPGKSPMGMDLTPVYEDEESGGGVKINPATEQGIGVRTAPVETRKLSRVVRAAGVVAYDETRVANIQSKTAGWIEHLYVNTTGQRVKKGDYLLEIYSPDLVATEEEFLLAARNRDATRNSPAKEVVERGGEMYEAAKKRLEYLDVPEHQIHDMEMKKKVFKTLHIHSPFDGVVVQKMVTNGMQVSPGMTLYTVADLSKVWVLAEVYEYELQGVQKGAQVKMTLEPYPGKAFTGVVTYIYPFLEKETRTVKVRIEFDNPHDELKPDMYARVEILSGTERKGLAVPKEAVIRSGKRDVVIVAPGGGSYAPREVTLGLEAEGYYEILAGLKEGENVLTSAQFLIDSESSLKEATQKMLADGQPKEAAVPATAPASTDRAGREVPPAPQPKTTKKSAASHNGSGHPAAGDMDMKDMDMGGMKMDDGGRHHDHGGN
ncbi:MAG: efflux RND transporter periplasmic adaptor subunit [Nitrospinae bacterium]|nr:efflux RND transporter periplasmic adaptor subunit [Nitrospinota bacterium]